MVDTVNLRLNNIQRVFIGGSVAYFILYLALIISYVVSNMPIPIQFSIVIVPLLMFNIALLIKIMIEDLR